jgi:hypothetical protein
VQNRIERKGPRVAGFFHVGTLLYAFDILKTLASARLLAAFCL